MNKCQRNRIVPIVRLATRMEDGFWHIPKRKDIVESIDFLSDLDFPTSKRYIIIYNEVNHAKEWNHKIDPIEYASVLKFASNWAHTEQKNYVVLSAAMDLEAPDGNKTMEAFNYLSQMLVYDPDIFEFIDAWNSHSYPNPGFSNSPLKDGKNSVRGFIHELAFIKKYTGRDLKVFITETGWLDTPKVNRWLDNYYLYTMQHVWSHYQVVAVTPFILQGSPGPFEKFSFLDRNSKPTVHYDAYVKARQQLFDY